MPPKSSRDELAQFLNDLDDLGNNGSSDPAQAPPSNGNNSASPSASSKPAAMPVSARTAPPPADAADAQAAMDFLDELSQRSSTPITLPPHANQIPARKSMDRPASRTSLRAVVRGEAGSPSQSTTATTPIPPPVSQPPAKQHAASPSWGWSSMWNSASSVIQQAREKAEENLAHLPPMPVNIPRDSEQAKKWTEGMLGMVRQGVDVDKIRESGMKAMTDIINAVAPPIAEHTVVEVWLSHDMLGYEGVETLVYRALAKIMEQVEGGELHVNSGSSEQPATQAINDEERNLNAVQGLENGYKLARANLDNLVKSNPSTSADAQAKAQSKTSHDLPITICPIYMRIQPVLAPLPFATDNAKDCLYFILVLRDPEHGLERTTISQAMPAEWLDIPFEENEWVENEMVDVIRKATETVGQDWVRTRQFGQAQAAQEVAAKMASEQEAGHVQSSSTAASESA